MAGAETHAFSSGARFLGDDRLRASRAVEMLPHIAQAVANEPEHEPEQNREPRRTRQEHLGKVIGRDANEGG